jgi:hypothetical protein
MIYAKIYNEDETRVMHVSAKDMKDLIDGAMQFHAPIFSKEIRTLEKTQRFKRDPEGEENAERESGWYYDC